VKRLIGEGGQGAVYLVDYAGEQKALKWYKLNVFKNPNAFKKNLVRNAQSPAPAKEFVWPLDIVEDENERFGYVMDLRPDGYYEATEFFLHNVYFTSYKRAVDACLNIISAFRQLHNLGLAYRDINGGNFFINPKNGKVLICDTDNVADPNRQTGIIGTPRFMAPEVVMGETMPNPQTDIHSEAVMLFMLLCMNHPLEGKRSLIPVLDSAHQKELYGNDPIFIMDPMNKDNAPNPKVHSNAIAVWECLPDYMREIFTQAFSKEALTNPNKRPQEREWIRRLTRFRSDIVSCTCGNEVFLKDGGAGVCDRCGKTIQAPFQLHMGNYSIPIAPDSRIFKIQVTVCDVDQSLDPIAQVVTSNTTPPMLGIMNMSQSPWPAVTTKGVDRTVAPGSVIPIKPGIRFTTEGVTVEIRSNDMEGNNA
jgi:serine/threonine protein kinase